MHRTKAQRDAALLAPEAEPGAHVKEHGRLLEAGKCKKTHSAPEPPERNAGLTTPGF